MARPKTITILGETRKFKIVDENKGIFAVAFIGNKGIFGYVRRTHIADLYEWV